ncbi:MAG: DUF3105 domain-containing protein [Thermoleophilia bacterium]
MSHRQQEKQRRREERLAKEQAEKTRAARRQRMQLVVGGVAVIAAIAVVVLLVSGGLGGGDGDGADEAGAQPQAASDVTLPEQKVGDLQQAAKAAGCRVTNPEIEGSTHESRQFAASDYKTNPPTSGNHFPEWYEDGVYEAGDVPQLGMLVHTLEHGRINVQYKPGTDPELVDRLEAFVAENDGYHMLLYENTTNMDAQVAATAWTHSLTCPEMNDKVFDAIRTFRARYIDKGPETVP